MNEMKLRKLFLPEALGVSTSLWRLTFQIPGSGAKMSLATNLALGLNRAAQAMGPAMEGTLAVLIDSLAYSRTIDSNVLRPQATLSQHLKVRSKTDPI